MRVDAALNIEALELIDFGDCKFSRREMARRVQRLKEAVLLRDVTEPDLPVFFEQQQLDSVGIRMAAFTADDPADRDAFTAHWAKILADDTVTIKTILYEGKIVGHLAGFERFGKPEVTYWIGKEYWGKGFATKALSEFLGYVKVRPLYARAAKDNIASIRVLEKCGFTISGYSKAFSNACNVEVEEVIMKLSANVGEEAH